MADRGTGGVMRIMRFLSASMRNAKPACLAQWSRVGVRMMCVFMFSAIWVTIRYQIGRNKNITILSWQKFVEFTVGNNPDNMRIGNIE